MEKRQKTAIIPSAAAAAHATLDALATRTFGIRGRSFFFPISLSTLSLAGGGEEDSDTPLFLSISTNVFLCSTRVSDIGDKLFNEPMEATWMSTKPGDDLIEQIARETAQLENRQAWAEIMARLRAEGCSPRQASKAQRAVWLIRQMAKWPPHLLNAQIPGTSASRISP